jgi:hypothetical protein
MQVELINDGPVTLLLIVNETKLFGYYKIFLFF